MSQLAERIQKGRGGSGQEVAAGGPPQTVAGVIESMRGELAKALPRHITIDHFLRVALTEVRQTPRLAECSTPSLLGSLMTAARLGLEPGGPLGQFYLTPRKVKGQWTVVPIVGYQGLRDLAYRSGQVDSVQAVLVRDGDRFRRGADEARGIWFEWEPPGDLDDDDDQRPVRGVLAVARIKGAGTVWRYLTRSKIEERKARGSAGDSGPWATDWDEMASKTGLRALSKDLPKSAALAIASQVDEQVQEWRPGTPTAGALAAATDGPPPAPAEPAQQPDGEVPPEDVSVEDPPQEPEGWR